jgi:hypothetical protein
LAINGRIGITATLVIFYLPTLVYNPHKTPRCHSLGNMPHSLKQMCQLVVNYDYGIRVGLLSPKIRGILCAVCTSSLLGIHGLKYDHDTFIEAWQLWFKYSSFLRSYKHLIENLDVGFVRLAIDSKVMDTLELVRHCWGYLRFCYTHMIARCCGRCSQVCQIQT